MSERTVNRRLTPDEVRAIQECLEAGESCEQLARDFGVNRVAIQSVRDRAGIPPKPPGAVKGVPRKCVNLPLVRDLLLAHHSIAEVAEGADCSTASVARIRKQMVTAGDLDPGHAGSHKIYDPAALLPEIRRAYSVEEVVDATGAKPSTIYNLMNEHQLRFRDRRGDDEI